MKSLKLCAAGLCVFLGACASFKTLDKGLAAMSGERIETAISVLGIPSQKMDLSATDSVYVWDTRSQVSFAKPRVATSYGTVGMQPFSVQTHYTEIDNIDLHCTIKALTKNGIISEWDYIGNAGCEHYIKRVEGYLEAKNANMPNEKTSSTILRMRNTKRASIELFRTRRRLLPETTASLKHILNSTVARRRWDS